MSSPTPAPDRLRDQLAQLDALIADGALTGAAARSARDDLQRQLQRAAGEPRPSRGLVLAVAAFILAVGAVGYAAMGNRAGWQVEPGMSGPEAAGSETDAAQLAALTAELVERLKKQPDDTEALATLGGVYASQGRAQDALTAFRRVAELKPRDAQALADLADSLAVANGRSLDGEPEKLVMQAVRLDPSNVKALALAGTVAFERGQYDNALVFWQRAVRDADPAAEFVKPLQDAIAEARRRASASAPAPAQAASATAAAAAASTAVAGRVTLKDSLRAFAAPDDTVFVFARAPTGSRMPLAILRRKVSDLPFDFSLDDSQAMSPATALSTVATVVVGARITKSGGAVPAPGDLQAMSAPVALGTRNIQLQIAEQLK